MSKKKIFFIAIGALCVMSALNDVVNPKSRQIPNDTPQYVTKAKDKLTFLYSDIYKNAVCKIQDINNSYYILCAPEEDGVIGGLFKIEQQDNSYQILTVNGKAMQHTNDKFETLRDPSVDIQSILEKFNKR